MVFIQEEDQPLKQALHVKVLDMITKLKSPQEFNYTFGWLHKQPVQSYKQHWAFLSSSNYTMDQKPKKKKSGGEEKYVKPWTTQKSKTKFSFIFG